MPNPKTRHTKMKTNKETGSYTEKNNRGTCVRYDTTRTYTQKQLQAQRKQFTEDSKKGKITCLTDLLITHTANHKVKK